MYSTFKVKKKSGTYSDTIEAFGLANLLHEIKSRANVPRPKLWIEDKGLYYELSVTPEITDDVLNVISYFPIFKYVIRNTGDIFEEDYFDYPTQRSYKKERQELVQAAYKEFKGKDKAQL